MCTLLFPSCELIGGSSLLTMPDATGGVDISGFTAASLLSAEHVRQNFLRIF